MNSDQKAYVTYTEMMDMVNEESGYDILKIVTSMESPFHGICTLAVCMAHVVSCMVDHPESAHLNLNQINNFMKCVASNYIKQRKDAKSSEKAEKVTLN